MHPADEAEFGKEVLRDPSVLFIDGPRWKSASPTPFRSLQKVGGYCIIWSPEDRPSLKSEFMPKCDDYYCCTEFATIQFLRSSIHEDRVLTEGRIAVSTTDRDKEYFDAGSGERVDARFKALRKFIMKHYSNSAIRWSNPDFPEHAGSLNRSANPSKPDASFWIGPAALAWMGERLGRSIKQEVNARVEGHLVS